MAEGELFVPCTAVGSHGCPCLRERGHDGRHATVHYWFDESAPRHPVRIVTDPADGPQNTRP